MSSEAIDRRLRRLSDLWKFGQSLKRAKWLGKVKDLEAAASGQKTSDDGRNLQGQDH